MSSKVFDVPLKPKQVKAKLKKVVKMETQGKSNNSSRIVSNSEQRQMLLYDFNEVSWQMATDSLTVLMI